MAVYLPHATAATQGSATHRMALPAIVALHVLFVYFWLGANRHPVAPADEAAPLMVRFFSSVPQTAVEAAKPLAHPVKPLAAASVPVPALTPLQDAGRATPVPAQSPAQEAPGAIGDITSSAMRSIGKIDRDMRKEFPPLSEEKNDSWQLRLQKGIAAAAIPREQTIQNKQTADGRSITKVSGPGYSYCVMSDSVALSGGFDQMQRGPRTKTVSCGHYFD
jgi:hypothetical protein